MEDWETDLFSSDCASGGPILHGVNDRVFIDKYIYKVPHNASNKFKDIVNSLFRIIFSKIPDGYFLESNKRNLYSVANIYFKRFELFTRFINLNIIPIDVDDISRLKRKDVNERISINYNNKHLEFTPDIWSIVMNELFLLLNN